ncbi:MAG TPA: condensation domain-containing protein, partial [Tahibacter sp.]|uniref:condensation domain-containing protein n=1 Tax=Tahibacter sp. TaxID=2056211 RepID=UPI002BF02789
MNITDLLARLQHSGVVASVQDGRLKTAAPKGAIDAELAALIRTHRDALIAFLQRADAQAAEKAKLVIAKAAPAGSYPLSFSQQRLWFIDRLQGGSAQYNIPFALKIRGDIDGALFQRTLDAVVARHDVLRTRFEERDGVPQQIVGTAQSAVIRWHDLSALDATAREDALQQLADAEVDTAFDLSSDLMLRTAIVKLADREHAVLFTVHHIAADGWSMGVLVKEFAQLYAAFAVGGADPLAPLTRQYTDYAQWQRGLERDGAFDGELAYWQEQLRQIPAVHALPLDRPRPAQQGFVAQRHGCRLGTGLLADLRRLAQRHDVTLFMLLQAALAAVLARWSGEHDIVIATPIAGRSQPEVAPLIGFFINTLALRSTVTPELTVAELLAQTRRTALDAYAHQNLPFDLLIDALNPERSLAYNPVSQIKFVLQNHESGALELPGLALEPLTRGVERVRFDLDLTASEGENGLQLSWTYKEELFDAASIERLAQAYELLLRQWLAR